MIQRLVQIVSTLTPRLMTVGDVNAGQQNKSYFILDGSISRSLGQHEKWVQLTVQIMCPSAEEVSEITGNLNVIPITEDVFWAMHDLIDQFRSKSPPLLNDNATRGSSTVNLVTQYITDSCLSQPEMPNVDIVTDRPKGDSENESEEPKTPDYPRQIIPSVPPKYDDSEVGPNPYPAYQITPYYSTKSGLMQIPATGPLPQQGQTDDPTKPNYIPGGGSNTRAATCGIVQLHLPITRYRYCGIAERLGKPPVIPTPLPKDQTGGYILLSWHVTPFYVVPAYDGLTPVYRCDFEFEYAKVAADNSANPEFPTGKLPFSLFGKETPVMTSDYFSSDILGI